MGSDPLLAWLLEVELIGRLAVLELDLEDKADAAAERSTERLRQKLYQGFSEMVDLSLINPSLNQNRFELTPGRPSYIGGACSTNVAITVLSTT